MMVEAEKAAVTSDRARSCSSTRSIASTKRSRTHSCLTWNAERSGLSARRRRIPRLRSTRRCFRAAACTRCSRWGKMRSSRLLERALADTERGLGAMALASWTEGALEAVASYSSGDARNALNALESAARFAEGRGETVLTKAVAFEAVQQRVLLYDKKGEQHYDIISALHKSVRNSDADAALYWLGRMLVAGEDPMYIARRVVRMAVEDIGLAAPEALNLCLSARDAMHFLGSARGRSWRLRRRWCIWRWRRSRMRFTRPSAPCVRTSSPCPRSRCRCTCATHRRS